jgi:hypothetical protein
LAAAPCRATFIADEANAPAHRRAAWFLWAAVDRHHLEVSEMEIGYRPREHWPSGRLAPGMIGLLIPILLLALFTA